MSSKPALSRCDTQSQVERLAQLFDGDLQVAVGAINDEEHNPSACGIADVTYVQGPGLAVARSGSHAFRIVPIVVVAADTPAGYRRVEPALFFTLVEVEEYAVKSDRPATHHRNAWLAIIINH